MRRRYSMLLVAAFLFSIVAGCTAVEDPVSEPTATQNDPTQAPVTTEETQLREEAIGNEDTYWVASQWRSDDEELALPSEKWWVDLTVWVDGTARLRDVHEDVCLADDSHLNLTWERTQEGEFLFYGLIKPEPVLRGSYTDGVLSLEYLGDLLIFQQGEMPQTVGTQYTPAELVGTWLCVSGETEGYQWEAMPGELSGLVIYVTEDGGSLVLGGDLEDRDHYGELIGARNGKKIEVLEEPLYEGCENERWSVRIGEASALDANGNPVETEIYATLTAEDVLLLQRHYTMDGQRAVSYQTYWRFPTVTSWMHYESMELDYSNWVCTGYENIKGEALPLPAELEGFAVSLYPDMSCSVSCGDAQQKVAIWNITTGGVLLIHQAEEEEDPLWFGGAITGYWVETATESVATYEMSLYCDGGIIRLALESHG